MVESNSSVMKMTSLVNSGASSCWTRQMKNAVGCSINDQQARLRHKKCAAARGCDNY
jgi:hypothetical protein